MSDYSVLWLQKSLVALCLCIIPILREENLTQKPLNVFRYSPTHKGYKCYNPYLKKIVSYDATFLENQSFYPRLSLQGRSWGKIIIGILLYLILFHCLFHHYCPLTISITYFHRSLRSRGRINQETVWTTHSRRARVTQQNQAYELTTEPNSQDPSLGISWMT